MFNTFHQSNFKRAMKNLFTRRKENVVLLEAHFGLGDNLICLGLIRNLAEKNPDIRYHLACLPQYFHSIAWMFQGSKNLFPTVVTSGREARQLARFLNATYQTVGIHNIDIKRFDESFYDEYKIPFEYRWSKSAVPAGPQSEDLYRKLNPENQQYILVCRTESGNNTYPLKVENPSSLKIIEIYPATSNIYDWTKLVEDAAEIHSIDTSFLHFVENVLHGKPDKRLYYHLAKKKLKSDFSRKLPWALVHYDE
ncbi:hypothetical protein [Polynucleobacter asymbioticus]|uniref:hypothetical protein n=1 Tax=Polynucleobacter asymbioticus TaxID=576611 RepID=UPI000B189848|nr:hypothetical protein [Polynucleobacter asymbioticus]